MLSIIHRENTQSQIERFRWFKERSTLGIFEPDHVLAALAGYEYIFVTIPIQIGDHGIVGHLIAAEYVPGEVALAIVLVPDGKLGFVLMSISPSPSMSPKSVE